LFDLILKTLDARVGHVDGIASANRALNPGAQRLLDTSQRPALVRRTYRVEISRGFSTWSGEPDGDDFLPFVREQGARLAEVLFAQLRGDLNEVLERPPTSATEEVPPPTAPSGPDVALHAGIEQRRTAILECTDGQAVDVVAAFSRDGQVTFSLAGPLAGTEAEACIRAAFGAVRVESGANAGAITHTVAPTPPSTTWTAP
jgi:hypothetical protein